METLPGHQQHTPLIAAPAEMMEQNAKFDFWGMLSRRKWIVFMFLVGGLLAATVYYYQAETVYESKAKIAIEPKDRLGINLARSRNIDSVMEATQTSHGDRIDSPTFIENCFNNHDELYNLDSFKGMSKEDVVYEVERRLEVEVDQENSDIYYLTFSSNIETDASTVLNGLIAEYDDELERKYSDETIAIIQKFEAIRTALEEEYAKGLNEVLAARAEHYATPLNTINNQSFEQLQLMQVQNSLVKIEGLLKREIGKRSRIKAMMDEGDDAADIVVWLLIQDQELVRYMGNDDAGSIGVNAQRMAVNQKLEQLNAQKNILEARYGPKHPNMVDLETEIAFWEVQLGDGVDGSGHPISQHYLSPKEMVRRYKMDIDLKVAEYQQDYSETKKTLNEILLVVKDLKRKENLVKLKEQQLAKTEVFLVEAERIVKQFNQTNSDKTTDKGYFFETLFKAKPGSPIWPNLPIVLGLGGLLGSLMGLGLGFLVDVSDKTFRSPDEITKQLGLPLIGHIPVISTSKRVKIENSLIDPVVCSFHRPKSQSAEAFRAIRTALYFNTQGKAHSVIQVTSPTPGDGKSTVACNIAVSIAQSGKRVLIVDGDMRRPTMHHMFGIKTDIGFAAVLAGDTRWEDCVFECEEIEGLAVMPCGPKPSNPAELITSPRVKQLINEMRQKYDFVIIDTPPLLAVTDPCPVAARVDGVILTLRIKKNVKISAERSTEILSGLGASIVGVVVNGVGVQTGYGSQYSYGAYRAGYSYNGYGYGYGYGYGNTGKYYEENSGRQARPPRRIEGPNGTAASSTATPASRD